MGVLAANAPYGTTYSSPAPPLFHDPFVTASNGYDPGQYFPVNFAPLNSSASHPDPNVDWSTQYVPISGIPAYPVTNKIPYTEEYMFSLERELAPNTLLSMSYVGTQAHRLLVLVESNPGDPALCLTLPGCGPFNDNTTAKVKGTRGPLGPNFGSDTNQSTIGNSNYNALEDKPASHQRTLAGICRLYLWQIFGPIIQRWRRSESDQSGVEPGAVGFRYKAQFCRQL